MENQELQDRGYTVLPQVEFGEAVKRFFNKSFQFTGRSRRSEFWWAQLGVLLIQFVVIIFLFGGMLLFGTSPASMKAGNVDAGLLIFVLLYVAWAIYINIAQLALTFRRLHDTGRSGWWVGGVFLSYVALLVVAVTMQIDGSMQNGSSPDTGMLASLGIFYLAIIILAITIFVFTLLDSKPGDNRYGKATKYVAKEEE